MGKEEEKTGGAGESDGRAEEVKAAGDGKTAVVLSTAVATAEERRNGVTKAAGSGEEWRNAYPLPLLPHEEVVGNPTAFKETLRRFHSIMGSRFMIPVMGGKELDLHLLYVEVTQRGGLEKVTVDRRWREVIAVFNFPPTTTSASFVLRKYYVSLLHHFEQVHFHGRQGPLVPPPASLHAKRPPFQLIASEHSQQQIAMNNRKRAFSDLQTSTSFTVSGTIDGKFDYGYLVTMKMGSEVLRGVLYHVPPFGPSSASSPAHRMHRRRKRGRRNRDPAHPKPNRSAYNFFFAEKHSKLRALYPNREREFSKMIGESWSKLTDEERMVYQDCGRRDKERYRREMQEYRERLKLAAAMGSPQT